MAYIARNIKDRVAIGDDIFEVEDLGNGKIRLIPSPVDVPEMGTPINKDLLQPIEDYLESGVVPVERTVNAGDGLMGGGDLRTDKTIKMGTPSTLSGSSANNVTEESHTHALDMATQAEAEAGTNNTKLVTPLRVDQRITKRLATRAEAEAGSNNTQLITPLGVQQGIDNRLATKTEAEAGSDLKKLMTPGRTKDAIVNHKPLVKDLEGYKYTVRLNVHEPLFEEFSATDDQTVTKTLPVPEGTVAVEVSWSGMLSADNGVARASLNDVVKEVEDTGHPPGGKVLEWTDEKVVITDNQIVLETFVSGWASAGATVERVTGLDIKVNFLGE